MNARRAEDQLLVVQAVLETEAARGRLDRLLVSRASEVVELTAVPIEAEGDPSRRQLLADVRGLVAAFRPGAEPRG